MDGPRGSYSDDWAAIDRAVTRLEEYLGALPYDRALPNLAAILRGADVPRELIVEDERARKLLLEAVRARPLHDHDLVARRQTEVELLTLEVGVLTATLRRAKQPSADAEDREAARQASGRLVWIRHRLDELRREL